MSEASLLVLDSISRLPSQHGLATIFYANTLYSVVEMQVFAFDKHHAHAQLQTLVYQRLCMHKTLIVPTSPAGEHISRHNAVSSEDELYEYTLAAHS